MAAAENAGVSQAIHHNHLGYERCGAKQATIEATGELTTFQVVRASDQTVFFEGELEPHDGFSEWGGQAHHYVADFSDLLSSGQYMVRVNGENSESFTIGDAELVQQTAAAVIGYFKSSRADDASVWSADQAVSFVGSRAGTADVRGGWYDASGDISKYLSHLHYANFMNPQQIPLVAWALGWFRDRGGAHISAALSSAAEVEAVFGADYLVRVQDPEGYFYTNVFDKWTWDLGAREVCAFVGMDGDKTADYQAAFREGGGMSIAALARIGSWGIDGAHTAAQYIAAAEKGFAHLQSNGPSYCDDGKENIIDDYTALLAASELFAATDDMAYLASARERAAALGSRLHANGYFIADDGSRPFWHASDAGLPVVALVRYIEVEPDLALAGEARDVIRTHLEYLLSVTDETANPFGYARQTFAINGAVQSGFFIPHDNETGYWWQGESARLASLSAAAYLGGRVMGEEQPSYLGVSRQLAAYGAAQLDWVLGRNPYDISMLAGYGRNNPPTYCTPGLCTDHDPGIYGHHDGGISNGITGREDDGSGIQWMTGGDWWLEWRWVEQWLPHAAWYLVATTAMVE